MRGGGREEETAEDVDASNLCFLSLRARRLARTTDSLADRMGPIDEGSASREGGGVEGPGLTEVEEKDDEEEREEGEGGVSRWFIRGR